MFSFCVKARSLHYESCGISSDLDSSKFKMAQSCRLCRRLWTVNESTGLFDFYNFSLNIHNIIYGAYLLKQICLNGMYCNIQCSLTCLNCSSILYII